VTLLTRFPLFSYYNNPVPWALTKDNVITPLGEIYRLFSNNYLGKLLPVKDGFGDRINGYASYYTSKSGKKYYHLFVINKDARPRPFTLNFSKRNGDKSRILDHTLDPWSVSFFKIPARLGRGQKITLSTIGAKEIGVSVDTYYASIRPQDR
jgi:hypothetical protein